MSVHVFQHHKFGDVCNPLADGAGATALTGLELPPCCTHTAAAVASASAAAQHSAPRTSAEVQQRPWYTPGGYQGSNARSAQPQTVAFGRVQAEPPPLEGVFAVNPEPVEAEPPQEPVEIKLEEQKPPQPVSKWTLGDYDEPADDKWDPAFSVSILESGACLESQSTLSGPSWKWQIQTARIPHWTYVAAC